MDCPTEERLARWLEGSLEDGDRSAVSDHLASCDDCRRTAALSRMMKDEPVHAITEAQQQAALRTVLSRNAPARWIWAAAAAAVLVSATAIVWREFRKEPPREQPVARHDGPKGMTVPSTPREAAPRRIPIWQAEFDRPQDSWTFQLLNGEPVEEGTLSFVSVKPGHPPASWNRADPMSWIGVETLDPLLHSSEDAMRLRFRTTAPRIVLWVEGYAAEFTPSQPKGTWAEEEVRLNRALLEGAPMTSGVSEFRTVYLGVPAGARLDVELLQILRPLARK